MEYKKSQTVKPLLILNPETNEVMDIWVWYTEQNNLSTRLNMIVQGGGSVSISAETRKRLNEFIWPEIYGENQ